MTTESDPHAMECVVEGHNTVSDKIRALDRAGYSRSEIARFLGKRYQHVRNVLVGDQQVGRPEVATYTATTQPKPPSEEENVGENRSVKVRLDGDGRVALPQAMRERLGLQSGDVLFARVEDGEIHLLTPRAAMARAQAILRQFVPEGVSLVDELIEDRRREAAREAENG